MLSNQSSRFTGSEPGQSLALLPVTPSAFWQGAGVMTWGLCPLQVQAGQPGVQTQRQLTAACAGEWEQEHLCSVWEVDIFPSEGGGSTPRSSPCSPVLVSIIGRVILKEHEWIF